MTQSEHERPVPMVTQDEALADHHDNKEGLGVFIFTISNGWPFLKGAASTDELHSSGLNSHLAFALTKIEMN